MTTCIAIIPGCEPCAAGPGRGEHECDDLCRMIREFCEEPAQHTAWHEPRRCNQCTAVIDDKRGNDRSMKRRCANGTCRIWACPDCDAEVAGDGPVGCPVCSPVCSPVEGEFAEHVAVAQERLAEWTAREDAR